MSSSDINAINQVFGNIQSQINEITGNTLSNYNQLSRIVSQQSNIYNTIYYGTGNLTTGNLTVNNDYIINGNLTYSNINLTGNLLLSNGNISSTVGNLIMNNGNLTVATGNLILSNGEVNILGDMTLSGFNYHSYTINNTNITINPTTSVRKYIFTQRFGLVTATSSTTYNLLKLSYTTNGAIIVTAKIVGHLYYGSTTSSGIYQENRVIIDINNTSNNTSAATVLNGTPSIASKGASVWTSCNVVEDISIAGETLLRVTPVFSGTQSLSASCLVIEWFIMNTTTGTGNPNINAIQFYAGV